MNITPMRNNLADMSIEDVKAIADQIGRSKMFASAGTAERAFTQLIIGQSLGLNILQAMNDLVVGNKGIELKAIVMASLIRRHPDYDYEIEKLEDDGCTIAFLRVNGNEKTLLGHSKFGAADAARAGLNSKETYQKHPRDMYFARALSSGAKKYCPDAIGGASVYVEGELPDNNASGTRLASVTALPQRADTPATPQAEGATAAEAANETGATAIANAIRALVGTAPKAVKKVNDFLGAMFDGTTLATLDTLDEEALEAILVRLREHKSTRSKRAAEPRPNKAELPITQGQKDEIERLRQNRGVTEDGLAGAVRRHYGPEATIDTLKRKQASEVIDELKAISA